jgi:proline dehydrogenase
MSVKVTGFARFALLEKMDTLMHEAEGTLMKRYLRAADQLLPAEKKEWHKVRYRVLQVCECSRSKKSRCFYDAEESWIQEPVDALTIFMMDMFNKERIVVYNTLQHYRHDRLQFLKDCYEAAVERNFILGAKLVRGAYMEKKEKEQWKKIIFRLYSRIKNLLTGITMPPLNFV